ncbi:hypothetical protein M3P05_08330 [Sansalvadorimonas sp. 2012CJ34-2]|uniref:Uncharacterized protein n=1 Tax=Parendozoicomonas callyspongiae TaxID=2942213 RepID=A0ABT0PEY2_9GAMM|nr:hypothetical protein [Sansalvadorimonas sp. 2012CJ34-2]MCL6269943.1 hypothetical protein [Sansalvadorimonas sp. 2012CJ34-2]
MTIVIVHYQKKISRGQPFLLGTVEHDRMLSCANGRMAEFNAVFADILNFKTHNQPMPSG